MELKKPLIIPANLGENYIRYVGRRSRRLLIASSVVSALVAFVISYFVLKIDLAKVIALCVVFLTTILIVGLFLQQRLQKRLLTIVNALHPLAQAKKGNQLAPFTEVENAILQQIYALKTTPQAKKPSKCDLEIDDLERVNFGIVGFDTSGKINYRNHFAEQFYDVRNQLMFDFGEEITLDEWISQAQANKLNDQRTWHNLRFVHPETEERSWYNITANFHKSSPNETLVLITETPEPTKDQEDFDFIAYAAHELRGPITIIRGYLDILKTDFPSKTETGQVIIERLTVAGNRLSGYINNILNVARLDQKSFNINPRPTSPNAVINEIYDDLNLRAKTNQKNLLVEIEPNLPEVNLDLSSITQAITNLVDNAIKYSKKSDNIIVKVFKKDNELLFQVIDRGIGMSPATLSSLFKRFYRSHRTQNQVGGTGIGLFITKAIVDAHHGTITVDSEFQKGSTFTISLPINGENITQSDNFIKNHGLLKR